VLVEQEERRDIGHAEARWRSHVTDSHAVRFRQLLRSRAADAARQRVRPR
jgi:hypothetical protein